MGPFAVWLQCGSLHSRHRMLEKAGFGGQHEFEPSVSLNFFLPAIRPCETKPPTEEICFSLSRVLQLPGQQII
jgi:hypothetical protein